jgi:hypothetical protein
MNFKGNDIYFRKHRRLHPYWRIGTPIACSPLATVLNTAAAWCAQSCLASVCFAKGMGDLRRIGCERRACAYIGGGLWRDGYALLRRGADVAVTGIRRLYST